MPLIKDIELGDAAKMLRKPLKGLEAVVAKEAEGKTEKGKGSTLQSKVDLKARAKSILAAASVGSNCKSLLD